MSFASAVIDPICEVSDKALHSVPVRDPIKSKSAAKCSAVVALPPFPKHQIVAALRIRAEIASTNELIDSPS